MEKSKFEDFRRRKLFVALLIMVLGMLAAVAWHSWQAWVLKKSYPESTFLFLPLLRFSDFSDVVFLSCNSNPYNDPIAVYLPFSWLCLRLLSHMPLAVSLLVFFFASVGGFFLLLVRVFEPVIVRPMARVGYALVFLVLSYPLLFCLDRGNVEIVVAVLIAAAVFFIYRAQYLVGMICLFPAIAFKLYPAIVLVLLLRQRKWVGPVCVMLAVIAVSFLSLYLMALPVQASTDLFVRNLAFFKDYYFYPNTTLEASASVWNAYKLFVLSISDAGLIAPVNFSYNSLFIHQSFAVYSTAMAILAVGLVIYIVIVEMEFLQGAMVLLIFLSIDTPTGGDYRLLYAGIALALLIAVNTRRKGDFAVLVLLALTMVPKKEILLTYAGATETGFHDVTIQVLLNPVFLLVSLFLLLRDGRTQADRRWSVARGRGLLRAFVPRLS